MTGGWRPLSARAEDEQWHEKLPLVLVDELRDWIVNAGDGLSTAQLARILVRLHLRFQEHAQVDTKGDHQPVTYENQVREFLAYRSSDKRVLDIVDAFLDLLPQRPAAPPSSAAGLMLILANLERVKPDWRQLLQQHLDDARVVYRIASDGRSLVRRVDAATAIAVQDAIAAANGASLTGSAATFLQAGWAALNGLKPDAPKAYSDAIKAVESAAQAVIQPKHAKATLGTMIGELRNASHLFKVQIGSGGAGDIEVLVSMMDKLWAGQTSRHGGQHPTRLETGAEARAALHLATALVAWFATGIVMRQPHR